MRRIIPVSLLGLLAASLIANAGTGDTPTPWPARGGPTACVRFTADPFERPDLVVDGEGAARVTWTLDPPAFAGDRPGSLLARYDSNLAAGRFGIALHRPFSEGDPFTAAALFVISSDGFVADPDGFFQISWGLWNRERTGLDRTGSLADFAGDTFELVTFDYYPAISPFFGGPFLSPSVFGVADPTQPGFPFQGAFANFGFASFEVALPLDEPLLAVIQHRPADDVLIAEVHRIVSSGQAVPVPGAVNVVPLSALARREYAVDAVGLTLWNDGFGGSVPALRAQVRYHLIVARPGVVEPTAILASPCPPRIGGGARGDR